MIYLAVFGALICAFLGGFSAQWLVLRYKQEDRCQPALDQLKEAATPELKKKEVRKPVLRRQWSEDMPAKDAN